MEISPEILRDALRAYVQTIPSRERLDAHLEERGLSGSVEEIRAVLNACTSRVEGFLFSYPGGVPWTEAFKREFEAHLLEKHAWLDRPCFDCLQAFARWTCWHDGLNAS